MIEKHPPFRSLPWLKAVRESGGCVLCGSPYVEAAHRNEGKGVGMKASDCLTAALCRTCHVEIDQGRGMTRDERRARIDRAIVLTVERLVTQGKVGLI